MTPTPAGMFRHTIELQAPTVERSPDGENVQGWQSYATVRAAILPVSGKWFAETTAGGNAPTATHKVIVRYPYGVTVKPTHRVAFGPATYRITQVLDIETRHRELQLMVVELVAAGGGS